MGSKLSSSAASDVRSHDNTKTEKVVIVSSNESTAGRELNKENTTNNNEYDMMDFASTISTDEEDYESGYDDYEDDECSEDRDQILADAQALEQLAVDYRHPEIGITGDYSARCYFDRPSALPTVNFSDAEIGAQFLQDMMGMKAHVQAWRNPAVASFMQVYPTVMGRCYFDRPSAPEQESLEETEERAQILADSVALMKLAVDYHHPEIGVATTDGFAMGRNYFDRPSAPEQESLEETEERAQILADSVASKKLAVDYRHPEIGVAMPGCDPTSFARNYFLLGSVPDAKIYVTEINTKERSESMASSHFEFDMEEHKDEFEEMKASLAMHIPNIVPPPPPPVNTKTADEEGSLSRSPSSVMLFGLDNSTAYY